MTGCGDGRSGLLVLEVKPPRLGQPTSRSGALQQFAPPQRHAVVRRSDVRRPGDGTCQPTHYSVCEPEIPQSQTLVAWRGGRRSSVTLVLGGGGDTVHWKDVWRKIKGGMEQRKTGCGVRNDRQVGCVKKRKKGGEGKIMQKLN